MNRYFGSQEAETKGGDMAGMALEQSNTSIAPSEESQVEVERASKPNWVRSKKGNCGKNYTVFKQPLDSTWPEL